MTTTDPAVVLASAAYDERLVWIGVEDRGIELDMVALVLADAVGVIRFIPAALRSAQ
jgi:hypothetical protein